MVSVKYIQVSDESVDIKLEKFLLKRFPNFNYIFLQKLIRLGNIRVNKKRVKQGYTLKLHDIIRIPINFNENHLINNKNRHNNNLSSSALKVLEKLLNSILYKNEHLVVINKPSGIATQGGVNVKLHIDLLLPHLNQKIYGDNNDEGKKLRLVHRLDKETSGALILAKSDVMAKHLFNQFKSKEIKKVYHCLIAGVPKDKNGLLTSNIIHDKNNLSSNKNKEAQTSFKVIKSKNNVSYLEVTPLTGRKHQIRIHLSQELKHPIVGDFKYGFKPEVIQDYWNEIKANDKIYLHSKSITFKDLKGNAKTVKASFDNDWSKALNILE